MNNLCVCTENSENKILESKVEHTGDHQVVIERVSRDGLKHDAATLATTITDGGFNGNGRARSGLSLGSVENTLNGEEGSKDIH